MPGVALAQAIPSLPAPQDGQRQVNPAIAAPAAPPAVERSDEIVVRGSLERRSSWRRAAGSHVTVYSNGSESDLRRITANLDREYHLLREIFGPKDADEDSTRPQIVLIGDAAFSRTLWLRNLRAEEGPFAPPFQFQRYYDPRDTGPLIALSRSDQVIPLQSDADALSDEVDDTALDFADPSESFSADPIASTSRFLRGPIRPTEAVRPWESLAYSAFAQNYVLTRFPGGYPRWYLDAIGALFSTMKVGKDGTIEYGRTPEGFGPVYNAYSQPSFADALAGTPDRQAWTPYHAWAAAHFFFFGDIPAERRVQFARYMTAIAQGQSPAQAAALFGDKAALDNEIRAYAAGKTYFYTMPSPAIAGPEITRLAVSDAEALKSRVELTARLEKPAASKADRAEKESARFDRQRAGYLADLAKTAAKTPLREATLLALAEAHCRNRDGAQCGDAADRARAVNPNSSEALAWKALALTEQAIAAPEAQRDPLAAQARAAIIAANRADTESIIPLLAYFRLHVERGQKAPQAALLGMLKIIKLAPAAPGPRLELGRELIRQGMTDQARRILLPVAAGPYSTPEQSEAVALLAGANGVGGASAAR